MFLTPKIVTGCGVNHSQICTAGIRLISPSNYGQQIAMIVGPKDGPRFCQKWFRLVSDPIAGQQSGIVGEQDPVGLRPGTRGKKWADTKSVIAELPAYSCEDRP